MVLLPPNILLLLVAVVELEVLVVAVEAVVLVDTELARLYHFKRELIQSLLVVVELEELTHILHQQDMVLMDLILPLLIQI